MRVHLRVAAIFIAVGLGALTVTLLNDPMALVPHPPYGQWIFGRLLLLSALATLGMLCVFGVEDDLAIFDEADRERDHATAWRAIGLAFLMSALCAATFIAVSSLVDYLDRTFHP